MKTGSRAPIGIVLQRNTSVSQLSFHNDKEPSSVSLASRAYLEASCPSSWWGLPRTRYVKRKKKKREKKKEKERETYWMTKFLTAALAGLAFRNLFEDYICIISGIPIRMTGVKAISSD